MGTGQWEGWQEKRLDMPTAGQRLSWNDVTWVHTLEYFVKPKTAERKCSYIELEVEWPQPPVYFVGLRWGLTVNPDLA